MTHWLVNVWLIVVGWQLLLHQSAFAQDREGDQSSFTPTTFPYRGWSIAVMSGDRNLEERYVREASARAPEYGINTLELHDYVMPGGIVEALVAFDSFPKLHRHATLTYEGVEAPQDQKEKDRQRFRRMLAAANTSLKINAWYHVMRDVPEEMVQEYPEITDLRSGLLWKYIDYTLTEFFRRVPEVDRLTLISLHETPSILSNTGGLSREEALLKLYLTIYEACRKAGKELIIRDFIVSEADYQTFWNILDRLPPDVYVMTKSVFADWSHLDLAINPIMHRYQDRKLIVEFDLYGEWSGRMSFPVCYPDDIVRHLRASKALNATGAVGRLIHDPRPGNELPFPTIFDSPLEVNCYAFARALSEPLPWLGETTRTWHEDIEAINKKYWMQWARGRYGEGAAVPIVRALERTGDINKLTFDLAGVSFRLYVWYPTLSRIKPGDSSTVGDSWKNFAQQTEAVGINYLRDEKRRALILAQQSLADVRSVESMLNDQDYHRLIKLFEGMVLIIRSYQAALESYYQLYLAQRQPTQAGLQPASQRLVTLAREIDEERGKKWYFGLADEMRVLAQEVLTGKTP